MSGYSITDLVLMLKEYNRYLDFWIRCDDVGYYEENTIKLIKLINRFNVEVVLCMIPTIIDSRFNKHISSNNFVLSQHGYSHKNRSVGYKCELSDQRNSDELLKEMIDGKNKIINMFYRNVDILTPPYNRIDINTQYLLRNYYNTLSVFADYKSSFKKDKNPYVDIVDWDVRKFGGEEFSNKQIIKALNFTNSIGICIHPNYLDEEGFEYIEELLNSLNEVKNTNVRRKKL